jgi:Outer membrane protein beta-barrel domain
MKTIFTIVTLCCILFGIQSVSAQKKFDPTDVTREQVEFKSSDIEITAGIGLFPTFNSPGAKARVIPISVILNYRIRQFLTVGGYFGYSSTDGYKDEKQKELNPQFISGPAMRNDLYIMGTRVEGHFNRERVDFYGGAMLSYNVSDVQKFDPNCDRILDIIIEEGRQGKFIFSGYVGMKYMITEHYGMFGEVGYGASLMTLGLTSKF